MSSSEKLKVACEALRLAIRNGNLESEYTVKAEEFLKKNNIRFSQKEGEVMPCDWDNGELHYMHLCRFYNRNSGKSMTVRFFSSRNDYWEGNSFTDSYSVLSCLQKYDVGDIENFISEFGYEIHGYSDFKKVEKTFKAVTREYKNVLRVFGDCLEDLREIQ